MRKFTTHHLKLIALFFMLIDHIAYVFIPSASAIWLPMRWIGRIAAPLFFFCFIEGFKHTSNELGYIKRLGFSAVIMACGNILISIFANLNVSWNSPNIFFTFFLMASFLYFVKRPKLRQKAIILIFLLAIILWAEYDWYAVIALISFYFIKDSRYQALIYTILTVAFCLISDDLNQLFMLFSLIFIRYYNSEKPKTKMKYFFYVFYPAHLWVFFIIKFFLLRN